MKCLTTALVAFFLFGIPAAFADDVSKNAKIEELMKLTNAAQLMNQMFDQMKTMQMAELNKVTVPPEARRSMQETQQKVHGGERNAADPKDRTRCPEGSWAAKQRSKHVRTDPATQRPFAMNLK